jgi:hypothetical protein
MAMRPFKYFLASDPNAVAGCGGEAAGEPLGWRMKRELGEKPIEAPGFASSARGGYLGSFC